MPTAQLKHPNGPYVALTFDQTRTNVVSLLLNTMDNPEFIQQLRDVFNGYLNCRPGAPGWMFELSAVLNNVPAPGVRPTQTPERVIRGGGRSDPPAVEHEGPPWVIPENVYWCPLSKCFYDGSRKPMGKDFMYLWGDHCALFPIVPPGVYWNPQTKALHDDQGQMLHMAFQNQWSGVFPHFPQSREELLKGKLTPGSPLPSEVYYIPEYRLFVNSVGCVLGRQFNQAWLPRSSEFPVRDAGWLAGFLSHGC